jgi:membrane protease YdiL (CAAX protease family)
LAAHRLALPLLQTALLIQLTLLLLATAFALSDGDGFASLGLFAKWQGYDAAVIAGIMIVHWTGSILTGFALMSADLIDMEGKAVSTLFESFAAMEPSAFLLLALGLAIVTGFAEELLFRGYVITRLDRLNLGAWPTVLLSALLFGLVHWPGYGLLPALSKAVWFGIPTGLFFWHRRNLGPLIAAHMLIDFLGFSMAYAALRFLPDMAGM